MADFEEHIERAASRIDPEEFRRLVILMRDHKWLERLSEELAELWNFCTTDQERQLIEDLIRRYCYIDLYSLTDIGQLIAKQICEEWLLSSEDTLIVATCFKWKADGSQAFVQVLKNKFINYEDWRESNFCNNIKDSLAHLNKVNNVVLADDFIGTGNTLIRSTNWYRKQLKSLHLESKVTLYVVAMAGMEFSRTNLASLNVNFFCPHWLKKGITEHYNGDDLSGAISRMESLEDKLEPKIKNSSLPRFGYGRSESLFAVESFNVPNNVFPVFWWPKQKKDLKRRTLLKRLV